MDKQLTRRVFLTATGGSLMATSTNGALAASDERAEGELANLVVVDTIDVEIHLMSGETFKITLLKTDKDVIINNYSNYANTGKDLVIPIPLSRTKGRLYDVMYLRPSQVKYWMI